MVSAQLKNISQIESFFLKLDPNCNHHLVPFLVSALCIFSGGAGSVCCQFLRALVTRPMSESLNLFQVDEVSGPWNATSHTAKVKSMLWRKLKAQISAANYLFLKDLRGTRKKCQPTTRENMHRVFSSVGKFREVLKEWGIVLFFFFARNGRLKTQLQINAIQSAGGSWNSRGKIDRIS